MKFIQLSRDKHAVVDDDMHGQLLGLGPWRALKAGKTFYAYNHRHGYMHHVVWGQSASEVACVDHRDGDGLNNQRSNLRAASKQQNGANRGRNQNNTSGYKGVSYSQSAQKWRAQIVFQRKQIFLGYFRYKIQAARAYNEAARQLFGEYAWLNPVKSKAA